MEYLYKTVEYVVYTILLIIAFILTLGALPVVGYVKGVTCVLKILRRNNIRLGVDLCNRIDDEYDCIYKYGLTWKKKVTGLYYPSENSRIHIMKLRNRITVKYLVSQHEYIPGVTFIGCIEDVADQFYEELVKVTSESIKRKMKPLNNKTEIMIDIAEELKMINNDGITM